MPIFELDPVDDIAVAAVGEPGQRQFFLLASGSGRTLTLTCEKSQIQALLVRLQQMMAAQGVEGMQAGASGSALLPGEPEWQVGEMGLGYHEDRRMFVLVASEGAAGDEAASEVGRAPAEIRRMAAIVGAFGNPVLGFARNQPGGRLLEAGRERAHLRPPAVPALRPADGPRRPPVPGQQRCPPDLLIPPRSRPSGC